MTNDEEQTIFASLTTAEMLEWIRGRGGQVVLKPDAIGIVVSDGKVGAVECHAETNPEAWASIMAPADREDSLRAVLADLVTDCVRIMQENGIPR